MVESRRLAEHIAGLNGTGGPISFYDAMIVVRRARAVGQLRDEALTALMALHDSDIVTDGARQILNEFLKVYAERVAAERARAARPITLDDDQQTVRAAVGDILEVELTERAGLGFLWETPKSPRGVYVYRVATRPTDKPGSLVACFRVKLTQAGHVRVDLEERPPPSIEPPSDKAPKLRSFMIHLLVDQR
jgi:hypothetical protein